MSKLNIIVFILHYFISQITKIEKKSYSVFQIWGDSDSPGLKVDVFLHKKQVLWFWFSLVEVYC